MDIMKESQRVREYAEDHYCSTLVAMEELGLVNIPTASVEIFEHVADCKPDAYQLACLLPTR